MWMRSCAVCKALLQKLTLCDLVRCQCGWEWLGHASDQKRGVAVAKIIEFYIPSNFQKKDKETPSQNRGKIIEFSLQTTKSA